MARYVTSVATPMSVADAFAYMADVTHFAEWDPGVTHAKRVTQQQQGVGTAYDLTVKAGGRTTMRYEVKEYDAPQRVLLVSRTTFLTSVDEVRVSATDAGSIVTYDAELTLNGPLKVFDAGLRWAFRRIGDRAAAGLRRALGGTTVAA